MEGRHQEPLRATHFSGPAPPPSPTASSPHYSLSQSRLGTLEPAAPRGAASMRIRWRRLALPRGTRDLCCDHTFGNGQCFGWTREDNGSWVGVIGPRVVALKDGEKGASATYAYAAPCPVPTPVCADAAAAQMPGRPRPRPWTRVVRLSPDGGALRGCRRPPPPTRRPPALKRPHARPQTDIVSLYSSWSQQDARLRTIAAALPGMRILRQDPLECLLCFICSSNNNVPRIRMLVSRLCEHYGKPLPLPADAPVSRAFFQFPTLAALRGASEADLRALGLGYRAKFIRGTVSKLEDRGGVPWLRGLRGQPLPEVRQALTELPGVGPKVADCVALFSLDATDAIPVDTHVWQIACRDLDPTLATAKSLTPTIYNRVGDLFRTKFGAYAGWAHRFERGPLNLRLHPACGLDPSPGRSILFAAELPAFRDQLPASLLDDMAVFRAEEKRRKEETRRRRKRARDEKAAAASGADGSDQPGKDDGGSA